MGKTTFRKLFVIQRISLLTAALALTGCASVMNDSNQAIRIETKTAAGVTVTGADCKADNDYGTVRGRSGDTLSIHRSGKDLTIECTHPDNPTAKASAISRANAGLAGNILIGGGIGAIVDHNTGKAYTYPTWLQLVFGQTIVFDRRGESEGKPVAGMVTAVADAASAPAAAASAAR